MTSYQPEHRRRALAFALALALALAGAALTLWLGVTGGRAFIEAVGREDVQLSPIPGVLCVIASVLLLAAGRKDEAAGGHVPRRTLRALAVFCFLFALFLLVQPFVTAS